MRFDPVRPLRAVATCAVMVTLTTSFAAADEPEGHRGPGRADVEHLAPPPNAMTQVPSSVLRPPVKLRGFAIPSATPLDKGSTGTEASIVLPLPPTTAEHAKLAAARAAVESARTAGTLFRARRSAAADAATRERILAEKHQRFRIGRTTPLAPDAPAGIGPDLLPTQKQGRPGLTAAERHKLEPQTSRETPTHVIPGKDARPEKGGR